MSLIPQQAQDTYGISASHSQFHNVGRDQYNYTNIINQSPNTSHKEAQAVLSALKPVDRSGYYVTPCMRGTRQRIIDQIHAWLKDPQAPNILWLGGSPGAGKSTIASTLVSQLAEMGQLGSSFFFKRGDVALSDPAAVWRTVAFDLAQVDPIFAERLVANLKERKADVSRPDIESHFKYMIEDPLKESWQRNTEGLEDNTSHVYVSNLMIDMIIS
jgi:hypothetical protein